MEISIVFIFMSGMLLGGVIGWYIHMYFKITDDPQKITHLENELRIARDGEVAARTKLESLRERFEEDKQRLQEIRTEMENSFKAMAANIANNNSEMFLKQASEQLKSLNENSAKHLDEKQKLIDKSLVGMNEKLEFIHTQATELKSSLDTSQKTTQLLSDNTAQLREVLSSSQKRGQWGERMVEDILQVIGLMENINYTKQQQVESGQRPDFTFFLPKEKKLNMDVKFPLVQYEHYLSAETDQAKGHAKKEFLDTVRKHIKAVCGREYINPAEGTLEYVMLFIPNEAIYSFINSEDAKLIDMALAHRVLLCSPLTLYAVLSLIHQATQNFTMNERASEVMNLVAEFRNQWNKYVEKMNTMGNRIDGLVSDFHALITTRTRALQRPLDKIENISLAEVANDAHKVLE